VVGDILVYRSNAAELPEMVRTYTAEGLSRYNVWLFSATDQGDRELSGQVPKLADVVPHLTRARDLGLSDRPDFITSLIGGFGIPYTYGNSLENRPRMLSGDHVDRFTDEEIQGFLHGGLLLDGLAAVRVLVLL
jgi:hypothetical protein